MNNLQTTLLAFLLALSMGLAPMSLFAHGEEHEDEVQYDPVVTDFGSYDPSMTPVRTIEVTMGDDMRFSPDVINVNQGDVIRFVHTNTGQLMHEFVLGTPESLAEHAEMMKKFPNMEHSEPYMAHVAPGESGEIVWQFSTPGEFGFGCLIPGHFDAGMKGRVMVDG